MSFHQSWRESLRTLFVFFAFALCFGCIQFQVVPIEEIEGGGVVPSEDGVAQPVEGGNAAQEFCLESGGQIATRQDNAGAYNACVLPDGSECELWALYDGNCGDLAGGIEYDDGSDADSAENEFTVDMGEEATDDHGDFDDVEMVGAEDWDIVQDMFFAGEVVGVSVESDDTLTITLIDESVIRATPPDLASFDDVLDVCGETCDAIFVSEP